MRGLKDKVVIVTGAAGGIGGALCARFAEEGSLVVGLDLRAEGLDELTAKTALAMTMQLDITDHAAVKAAGEAIVDRFGRIDVLVNNAGWDVPSPFLESEPSFWEKVVSVNLMGPLNMHHAVIPLMIAGGGGKVVNIASDAGRVGSSGESVYSACKGGIVAFTKTLARELAKNGVLLNSVCPGPTDTAILRGFFDQGDYGSKLYEALKRSVPLKRIGAPEDIPGIVAFLSSDDAGYITGQVISVSGGLTMHG